MAKLSICMATFNRASFIVETLDSIFNQIDEQIEVVIVDGASTDNTYEIVSAYARSHPGVRYFRQPRNGGVDQDFDLAVRLALGDYCWLMSDDDPISLGAIDAVLKKITVKPSLVVINAEVRSSDLANQLDPDRLRIVRDRTYSGEEIDLAFRDLATYVTFIGCFVVNRVMWLERQRSQYFGSLFIHIGTLFQSALPSTIEVIASPLIQIRFGNAMWKPKEFEVWMIRWPALVWSLNGISQTVKAHVCPPNPWRNLKSLFFYRAKGTYSMKEYRQWVKPNESSAAFRALAIVMALVPGVLANAVAILVCSLAYRQAKLHKLDMKRSRFYLPNVLAKFLHR